MNKPVLVNQPATLKNYLEKGKKSLSAMIGNEKGAERLIRLALVANAKLPKIRDCTHESLLRSLIECAQLNLEPFTALQQCYIIPYEDRRKGITEAQFMLGYRGIVSLTARADISLDAHVVYENDEFECILGTEKKLKHIPNWREDRGEMIAVYAVAQYKSGLIKFDIMNKSDVEKIRKRSKSPNNGPWVTDYEEMAKKTIVRRLAKYLDMNPEVKRAIEKDAATDTIDVDFDFVDIDTPEIDVGAVEPVPALQSEVADKSISDYRNEIRQHIKDAKIADSVKSDLMNRLVLATDRKAIDQVAQMLALGTL
jgi:recombination protein RecT